MTSASHYARIDGLVIKADTDFVPIVEPVIEESVAEEVKEVVEVVHIDPAAHAGSKVPFEAPTIKLYDEKPHIARVPVKPDEQWVCCGLCGKWRAIPLVDWTLTSSLSSTEPWNCLKATWEPFKTHGCVIPQVPWPQDMVAVTGKQTFEEVWPKLPPSFTCTPNRRLFYNNLAKFLLEDPTIDSYAVPKIYGHVDLYSLYQEVTAMGGLDMVIKHHKFSFIAGEGFDFPHGAGTASFQLKKVYQKFLFRYEQANFDYDAFTAQMNSMSSTMDFPVEFLTRTPNRYKRGRSKSTGSSANKQKKRSKSLGSGIEIQQLVVGSVSLKEQISELLTRLTNLETQVSSQSDDSAAKDLEEINELRALLKSYYDRAEKVFATVNGQS